jgi:hypothetical protein
MDFENLFIFNLNELFILFYYVSLRGVVVDLSGLETEVPGSRPDLDH